MAGHNARNANSVDVFLDDAVAEKIENLVYSMFPPAPFDRGSMSPELHPNVIAAGDFPCDGCSSRSVCAEGGWACESFRVAFSEGYTPKGRQKALTKARVPMYRVREIVEEQLGRALKPDPQAPGVLNG